MRAERACSAEKERHTMQKTCKEELEKMPAINKAQQEDELAS